MPGVVAAAPSILGQTATPTEVTVGTPVVYEVALSAQAEDRVRVLPLSTDDPNLDIDLPTLHTAGEQQSDQVRVTATFTVRAFSPGDHTIPSVEFQIIGPSGSEQHLSADPFVLHVSSVLPPDAKDILDIKPVQAWQGRRWWPWVAALAVLLFAALALWYILRYRSRRRQVLPPLPPPPRPAHVIALEALTRLEASDLLMRDEMKLFFVQLSEIIREYLGHRYDIPALELTTPELLSALNTDALDWENRQSLTECLHLCDLVKFAKYLPVKPDAHQQLEQMREFVRKTRW